MTNDFWGGTTSKNDVDVPAFFDSRVIDGIVGLLQMGVLVSLGTTRDGGAIAVAVFNDGKRRREYFRDPEAASDFLLDAASSISSAGLGDRNGDHPRR